MNCGLTKYGLREVAISLLLLGAAGAALARLWWPAAVPLALPAAWVVWFFRDPGRQGPAGEGLFLSPADGRVSDVTHVGADSVLGREGTRIGIFMSIFDVHVNRAPEAGRVVRIDYRRGAFLDARDADAAERNESATIHVTCTRAGRTYPMIVRQVAGLIARRIVTDLAEGRVLRRGERIGMVKFGSRVELILPKELCGEVRVAPGRRVRAGVTVLVAAPENGDGHQTS